DDALVSAIPFVALLDASDPPPRQQHGCHRGARHVGGGILGARGAVRDAVRESGKARRSLSGESVSEQRGVNLVSAAADAGVLPRDNQSDQVTQGPTEAVFRDAWSSRSSITLRRARTSETKSKR